MLFNSYEFLIFFPVVCAVFFRLPQQFRWVWLLAASYFFYMWWRPEYVILLLLSTIVDYVAARGMQRALGDRARALYLLSSIACNLGLLFTFKYAKFARDSLAVVMDVFSLPYTPPDVDVLLPVGISFYTFQTMSYTIDVYRRRQGAESHPGYFALYVAFFPQLVAGPIERPENLLPQLKKPHRFNYDDTVAGLRLILWGLFKKMAIADRLAELVNTTYADPKVAYAPMLFLASIGFAYQIYCDFSGYSDVAIGAARVMGIRLMRNFDTPYHARSIPEFWSRWHISLSTWFRDYVYIPLGGNRVSKQRWTINIIITFLLSGLWHGANWTFVVWGLYHGMLYLASVKTAAFRQRVATSLGLTRVPRLHRAVQILITVTLVNIGWILFRAETFEDAMYVFRNLFGNWDINWVISLMRRPEAVFSFREFVLVVVLVCFLEVIESWQRRADFDEFLASKPALLRWALYLGLALGILNFANTYEIPFVYFQF